MKLRLTVPTVLTALLSCFLLTACGGEITENGPSVSTDASDCRVLFSGGYSRVQRRTVCGAFRQCPRLFRWGYDHKFF